MARLTIVCAHSVSAIPDGTSAIFGPGGRQGRKWLDNNPELKGPIDTPCAVKLETGGQKVKAEV